MSLLIKNGKIFQNGSITSGNIFIDNGKIAKITGQDIKADEILDITGKIVIPGLIDGHVHFRDPGDTHKEDFLTGSMAAAAGGISTILDMPNTKPPTTDILRLEEKRTLAKKSIVNYGFHFGSTQNNIAEIEKAENVASVKVYMDHTTGNLIMNDQSALKKIFASNKTIATHAENEHILNAVELIQGGNNRLHICHVSSKKELEFSKGNKIKNPISVEVCPHHLFLTSKNIDELGNFGEMKPILKTEEDRVHLWKGIYNGSVDTIATDHAPHTKEEKMNLNYPFGVPGCETMLPLLLDSVNKGKLSLNKLVQLCCENPSKIFKIRNKGFIKQGFDADLAIIDMNLEKEVKNKELFTKSRWSPFDGWKLKGWPVYTIVNGNIIFDNGKINNIKAKEIQYKN